MRIIAVLNQKGGSGKSTLALALAGTLGLQGHKVLLADADSQGTSTQAGSEPGQPFEVVNVSAEGRRLATALRKLGAGHDFVIVDGPPSVSNALTEVALAEAELCLVPVRPSGPDLFATTTMLKLIETVQSTVNQKLAARMVITQAARTNLASQVIEALRGFNVPLLTAQMGSRAAYPESQLRGVPVQNLGAAAKPASLEVEAITAEVLSILGELK